MDKTYQLLLSACHFTHTHTQTNTSGCVFRLRLGVKSEEHVQSNRHHLLARNVFGESRVVFRSVANLREKDDTEHSTLAGTPVHFVERIFPYVLKVFNLGVFDFQPSQYLRNNMLCVLNF